MLDKIYMTKLKKDTEAYALKRREIIKEAGDALHHAKRAIFALQRGNRTEAEERLHLVEHLLGVIEARHKKEPLLLEEGAYRAAVEEYVEAFILFQFVLNKKFIQIKAINVEPELYLAGLCDVPGELYRLAIKAGTNHDIATVKRCAEAAEEVIGELMEFDLTSYLRTKFDQAKQAAHKLEQVVYDLSL